MLEHVAMYVARLHSEGRKHYNMRPLLCGIFWNAHQYNVYMSSAAGDGRTIHIQFAHDIPVYVGLAQACPNYTAKGLHFSASYYVGLYVYIIIVTLLIYSCLNEQYYKN